MRGDDNQQEGMFSYVSPEKLVPADHPLRPIRNMVDEILKEMSPQFAKLYSDVGRVEKYLQSPGVARKQVEYRKRQTIFSQGDGCDSVLYLQRGTVKLTITSETGKEAVIAMLSAGDFFGEGAHMLKRNVRIEEDLTDQLFNSSEKRLARTLLLVARYGKEEEPEKIVAKISQEMLAEMIGTTRSRVSFFMSKFRKLGYIKYNGGMQINSSLLRVVLRDS